MSLVIRPIRKGDRAALRRVITSDDTFKPEEVKVAIELVTSALDALDDYRVLVAVLDKVVSGYICFGPTPMTVRTYDLYWIVVAATARGRGVARALIEHMEAELRAAGGANVRVETSKTENYGSARHLYANLGYPEVSRLKDFYSPGDDLITYFKGVTGG